MYSRLTEGLSKFTVFTSAIYLSLSSSGLSNQGLIYSIVGIAAKLDSEFVVWDSEILLLIKSILLCKLRANNLGDIGLK